MTAQPWEIRLSRLEGSYEQVAARLGGIDRRLDGIDRRLDGMDRRLDGLDVKIDGRFDTLDRKIDAKFFWLLGGTLCSWVTIILTILFHR